MKIEKLIENLNKVTKEFEVQVPTEEQLDQIYDAINILNRAEWFVKEQKDADVLIEAQKILKSVLNKYTK